MGFLGVGARLWGGTRGEAPTGRWHRGELPAVTSRALPELSGWSEKSQSSAVLEVAEVAKKGFFKCPHSKRKAKEGVDLLLFGVEDPGTKDMEKAEIFSAFMMLEPMVFHIFINDFECTRSTLVGDPRLRASS